MAYIWHWCLPVCFERSVRVKPEKYYDQLRSQKLFLQKLFLIHHFPKTIITRIVHYAKIVQIHLLLSYVLTYRSYNPKYIPSFTLVVSGSREKIESSGGDLFLHNTI